MNPLADQTQFCDLAVLLIHGSYTDRFARMFVLVGVNAAVHA
jgi:hypothetical protein